MMRCKSIQKTIIIICGFIFFYLICSSLFFRVTKFVERGQEGTNIGIAEREKTDSGKHQQETQDGIIMEDSKIKIFLAVKSQESSTRAAEMLGISQPAVSHSIAELEKSLGARLFHRSKQGFILTDEGRTFLKYAERIDSLYRTASEIFTGKAATQKTLRLSASPDIISSFLPEVIASLRISAPDLSCSVSTIAGKMDGEPDFHDTDAIISSSIAADSLFDLDGDAIATSDVCAAVSARSSLPFRTGTPDSGEMKFACWSECRPRTLKEDFPSATVFLSDSVEAVKKAVLSDTSLIAILPHYVVAGEIGKGEMKTISVPFPLPKVFISYKPSADFAKTGIGKLLPDLLLPQLEL